jgi:hypothetical protein
VIRIGTSGVRLELGAEAGAHERDAVDQPDVDVAEGEIREVFVAGDQRHEAVFAVNDAGAGGK